MLFGSVDRSQPRLSAIQPKFVSRDQIKGSVIERAGADFNFVGAVDDAVKS